MYIYVCKYGAQPLNCFWDSLVQWNFGSTERHKTPPLAKKTALLYPINGLLHKQINVCKYNISSSTFYSK